MKSYTILADYSTHGLAAQVNTFIANGWQVHEALIINQRGDQTEYIQAMVKF